MRGRGADLCSNMHQEDTLPTATTLVATTAAVDTSPSGHSEPARNSVQAWSPAALLQPGRGSSASPHAANPRQGQAAASRPPPPQNPPVVFQFTTPDETAAAEATDTSAAPTHNVAPNALGSGSWVENVHNVQARSEAPEAKRRRVDPQDAQNGAKIAVRGGSSGILGQYVKDSAQDASGPPLPSSHTVDLTDGMVPLPRSSLTCPDACSSLVLLSSC